MKADNDLHKMEKLFREMKVPYVRGSVQQGPRQPYLSVAGTFFLFHANGSFEQTVAHVAINQTEVRSESNDYDQRPVD